MKQRIFMVLLAGAMIFSCQDSKLKKENEALKKNIKELKITLSYIKETNKKMNFLIDQMEDVKAKIITNYGDIELRFYPKIAPLTCFNFITRAESGYYDNTLFHRVIPGFMIQAGDPLTKTDNVAAYGSGGPLVHIPHEFNSKHHNRGMLSMARVSDVSQGAGSQFFICQADVHQLDNQYTVFGTVTDGMDVVDKIANAKRNQRDMPLTPVRIKTIKVYR